MPSGVASREAYAYYLRALEADPTNFRTLDEATRLAEKLKLPAAERVALFEKYRATTEKYDACMLRLAYACNAAGNYRAAHEILTTRRFHVWEGADGLLAPFVEACVGLVREGIALGYHNHAQEFEIRFDGQPVIDLLSKQFDPAVTFEPDPGWCRLAGGDPVDFMRRFAGRYRMLHVMPAIPGVTDGAPADYPLVPGACGVGSERDLADWRKILAAAREGGAEWLVVKPTAHSGAIDDLRASFASLGDLV